MKSAAVTVCRNDHYGDNLYHRAKLCLSSLAEAFDVVYYIDWKTRELPLTSEIKQLDKYNNIVTISVPRDLITKRYGSIISNHTTREFLAKNIGIRAAINNNIDWICSTNIDILMNKPNFSTLNQNTLYTARRYNIPKEIHMQFNTLKTFKDNIFSNITNFPQSPYLIPKELKEQNSHIPPADCVFIDAPDRWSLVANCGDFQLAHSSLWSKVKGFEEKVFGKRFLDSNLMKKASTLGYSLEALTDLIVIHLDHTRNIYPDKSDIPLDFDNDYKQCIIDFLYTYNENNWGIVE